MAGKRTRASINEPAESTEGATARVRGTAETTRTNVGRAVPASRPGSDDSLLLRQILAALQTPRIGSPVAAGRQTGSDDSVLLRKILEELEGINRRLEGIERKLA